MINDNPCHWTFRQLVSLIDVLSESAKDTLQKEIILTQGHTAYRTHSYNETVSSTAQDETSLTHMSTHTRVDFPSRNACGEYDFVDVQPISIQISLTIKDTTRIKIVSLIKVVFSLYQ